MKSKVKDLVQETAERAGEPSRSPVQHTPGPWSNREHSTFVHSAHGNVCACGDPHASRYVGYTEVGPGSQSLNEAVANARVCAASLDLLVVAEENGSLIEGAQAILTSYLIPDGISAKEAISQLLMHFDGPEQRRIKSLHDAAIAKATTRAAS